MGGLINAMVPCCSTGSSGPIDYNDLINTPAPGIAITDPVSGASAGGILFSESGLLANSEKFRIVTGLVAGAGVTPVITGRYAYSGSICLEFGGVLLGRLDEAPPGFGGGNGVKLGGFVGPGGGFWFSYSENNLFSTPDLGITKASSTALKVELAAGGAGSLEVDTLLTKVYTVGTLPSGTVARRAFVSDETTGISHATAVGAGSLDRPVYYGNGQWRVG
jgi:hypothetical protein